jgi:hypothetical protein
MQFLWNLLPGAREARNDLVVGYVWLLSIGLLTGVPAIDRGSAGELVHAAGSVGIGIALSVVAFLLGSFSSDMTRLIPGLRASRAFTTGWSDPVAVLRVLDEREIAELNRLEGAIDRNTAEVSFRLSLVPPVLVIGAVTAFQDHWWWGLVSIGVAAALIVQGLIRQQLSRADIYASRMIREGAAAQAKSQPLEGRREFF